LRLAAVEVDAESVARFRRPRGADFVPVRLFVFAFDHAVDMEFRLTHLLVLSEREARIIPASIKVP
jgi:hypothetical protein